MVAITKFLMLAMTASATPILQRDAVTVGSDITQKIGPQIATLNKDVNGFPASGPAGAAAIGKDADALIATLKTATDNVKSSGAFSFFAGVTILRDVQALVPKILSTLVSLSSKKSSLDAIPGATTKVLTQLKSLSTAHGNYLDQLVAKEPLPLKPAGLAVKYQVAGAFAAAIAAFNDAAKSP